MYQIDLNRVRGKMGEKGYSITSLAHQLEVSRGTLSAYFKYPGKMPYCVVSNMAQVLCDSPGEAKEIFFAT